MENLKAVNELFQIIALDVTDGLELTDELFKLYSYEAMRKLQDSDIKRKYEIIFNKESEYNGNNVFSIPSNVISIDKISTDTDVKLTQTYAFNDIRTNEYFRNGNKIYVNNDINKIKYLVNSFIFSHDGYPMIKDNSDYDDYIKNYILANLYRSAERRNMVPRGSSTKFEQDYLWAKGSIEQSSVMNELKIDRPFDKNNVFYGSSK